MPPDLRAAFDDLSAGWLLASPNADTTLARTSRGASAFGCLLAPMTSDYLTEFADAFEARLAARPVRELRTVQETAEMLRVHPDTVRRLIEVGQLRRVDVGRQVRIPLTDVIALMTPNPPAARPGTDTPENIHDPRNREVPPRP